MSPLDTDLLTKLVQARFTCLTLLRDIGRRQLELVEQRNLTSLLDVLAAKQRPLLDLQRIERALAPFRDQDPEQRVWHSQTQREQCAGMVRQCDSLLAEILAQEKFSENCMTRQRDETAAQLRLFQTAGQAHGAYAAASATEISQIDLSSER